MYFFFSLFAFLALLLLVSYYYRDTVVPVILPHIPQRVKLLFPTMTNYTRLSTFAEQSGAGLTSSNFDLEANMRDGDSRSGLDERATQEVLEIMRRERVTFDQARLIRQNRIFAANGIDPSGMPLDSKAVTRL